MIHQEGKSKNWEAKKSDAASAPDFNVLKEVQSVEAKKNLQTTINAGEAHEGKA